MPKKFERDLIATYCKGAGVNVACKDVRIGGPGTLQLDRDRTAKAAQIIGDAKLEMFANNSLDLIEHYLNTRELVRAWLRVLKPGGVVALTCPKGDTGDMNRGGPLVHDPEHHHLFTEKTLPLYFRHAGYEVVECRALDRMKAHGFPTDAVFLVARKKK